MASRSAGSIPRPLSRTLTSQRPPRFRTEAWTLPPGCVNLSALLRRLPTIWVRRAASASTQAGSAASDQWSSTPRCSNSARRSSQARRTGSRASIRSSWSSIFPCVIRVMSSRSSTSRERCSVCRWSTSCARSAASLPGAARSSTKMPFRMGASGFRSSCESTARNPLLRRSASRSASSASFRWVMSLHSTTARGELSEWKRSRCIASWRWRSVCFWPLMSTLRTTAPTMAPPASRTGTPEFRMVLRVPSSSDRSRGGSRARAPTPPSAPRARRSSRRRPDRPRFPHPGGEFRSLWSYPLGSVAHPR